MRVAIDAGCFHQPLTGIGHFVHRLIGAMLPLLSHDEELLALTNKYGLQSISDGFLSRIQSSNIAHTLGDALPPPFRGRGHKAYYLLRKTYLARKAACIMQASRFRGVQRNFDLFHAVNYVPPGRLHKPALPIIYDLSHIRFPQFHPNERIRWLETNLKFIIRSAYIQTISEFTKSEIVSILGISPDRIFVTYPAPGEYFRPEKAADDHCLTKYRLLNGNYFLVVGTREPRKNFKTVAQAYVTLPEVLRRRFPLLWVGPSGWGDVGLSIAVAQAMEAGQIRIIGYVPDRDLAALYRNTMLFLMPSIYEGFGMPLVEALACGAPAAVSRIPVFEEIAGRCARYVKPLEIEAWRSAMQDAIDARGASIVDGEVPVNLSRFSWHASAGVTLDLYRRCVSAVAN